MSSPSSVVWAFDIKSSNNGDRSSGARSSVCGELLPSGPAYPRRPPHRIQPTQGFTEDVAGALSPGPSQSTSLLERSGEGRRSRGSTSFLPSGMDGIEDGTEGMELVPRRGRGSVARGRGRGELGVGRGGGRSSLLVAPRRGGPRGRGTASGGALVPREWDTNAQVIGRGGSVRESTLPMPSSLVQRTTGNSGVTVAPPTVLSITPTFVPYVDNSKTLTPEGTVRELQKNYEGPAKTAKGRAIQEDLRKLANDYFGGAESRAPPKEGEDDDDDTDGGKGKLSTALALRNSNFSRYARFDAVYLDAAVPKQWKKGPLDAAGRFFDASDRNLLCMDVLLPKNGAGWGEEKGKKSSGGLQCVVGSADHGLRVFETSTMKELKNLYNKDYGHTEWVTSCKYLPSGQILSGGMDSKLCLWNRIPCAGPAKCQNLLGHTASISQVEVNENSIAVSASYDRTLRIWDCNGGGKEIGCLAGHKAAVMQFSWNGEQIISGDRQGQAKIWDLPNATCVSTLSTKRGQISALGHLIHNDFGNWTMFGDQGGVLTILDFRQGKKPVYQNVLHPSAALTSLKVTPDAPYVISCGADSRLLALDPRKNFDVVHEWTDHKDYVYSVETVGSLVLSGGGNGWLLVHDTKTGKCLYGLGASKAAVRSIFAAPKQLICAGDDGKAAVYDY